MKDLDTDCDVRLAHHWFVSRRGGERVVEEIARLFPGAPVSTLVLNRAALGGDLPERSIQVSPLRWLSPRWVDHRTLLPLFPWAVRRLRVPPRTRLLISTDAALIKGIPTPPGCVHVCYCFSPPRYLWDMSEDYAKRSAGMGAVRRWGFRRLLGGLRRFDLEAAGRVAHFIGCSTTVAERIRRIYGRESAVIHPSVEVERFHPSTEIEDYYLIVAEMVSYKRVDLAVAACSRMGRRLVVVGNGPELPALRAMAGPSIEFRGRLPDDAVSHLMARAQAFFHPQLEDFGIAAVEAQAAGRPVIAFRGGGALETVIEGQTGWFFDEQTPEAVIGGILRFESERGNVSAEDCRVNAGRFSPARFRREVRAFLEERALV